MMRYAPERYTISQGAGKARWILRCAQQKVGEGSTLYSLSRVGCLRSWRRHHRSRWRSRVSTAAAPSGAFSRRCLTRCSADDTSQLSDFIEADQESPEEHVEKSMLRDDLENVINSLSPRERDVVRMRYGLDDGRIKTLEEIGQIFSVTRERVRQIEAKAI